MPFDFRHAIILRRAVLLIEELNSFATQQDERQRIPEIRVVEVQYVAVAIEYRLMQTVAVTSEIGNHLGLHGKGDDSDLIVFLHKAIDEGRRRLEDFLRNGRIEIVPPEVL